MNISNNKAVLIIACVVIALFVIGGCKMAKRDNFTRTCVTADTNCSFVRSPVDYAFENLTEVPQKMGMEFPHMMANPTDKALPLEDYPVNLIKDEGLLWNQNKLWKQYENNWKGCGNNKPFIVNDEKTRFALVDAGNYWAERLLYSQPTQPLAKGQAPPLTDQSIIEPEPFSRLYGGNFIHQTIGYT